MSVFSKEVWRCKNRKIIDFTQYKNHEKCWHLWSSHSEFTFLCSWYTFYTCHCLNTTNAFSSVEFSNALIYLRDKRWNLLKCAFSDSLNLGEPEVMGTWMSQQENNNTNLHCSWPKSYPQIDSGIIYLFVLFYLEQLYSFDGLSRFTKWAYLLNKSLPIFYSS